jgi:hypothetical protein
VIVRTDKGFTVFSEGTPRKRLGGPYKTRKEATKRLQQVEYFKHTGGTYGGGKRT